MMRSHDVVREHSIDRERYGEGCAFAQFALHADLAVMHLDDFVCDREAKPAASGRALAGLIDLVEALEDTRHIFLRYADSAVADLEPDVTILAAQIDADFSVRRGELDAVMKEVDPHL